MIYNKDWVERFGCRRLMFASDFDFLRRASELSLSVSSFNVSFSAIICPGIVIGEADW